MFQIEVKASDGEILPENIMKQLSLQVKNKDTSANAFMDGLEKSYDLSKLKNLKKGSEKRINKADMSFDSSDLDAYKDEDMFPVPKLAYMEYERNMKKAMSRRGQSLEQSHGLD